MGCMASWNLCAGAGLKDTALLLGRRSTTRLRPCAPNAYRGSDRPLGRSVDIDQCRGARTAPSCYERRYRGWCRPVLTGNLRCLHAVGEDARQSPRDVNTHTTTQLGAHRRPQESLQDSPCFLKKALPPLAPQRFARAQASDPCPCASTSQT